MHSVLDSNRESLINTIKNSNINELAKQVNGKWRGSFGPQLSVNARVIAVKQAVLREQVGDGERLPGPCPPPRSLTQCETAPAGGGGSHPSSQMSLWPQWGQRAEFTAKDD